MPQVAILGHMQRFYDLLDSKADTTDDGGRVYSGHTTQDFYSLDLPQPYYSRMIRLLAQMGCMTQLERGSRNKKSVWILHHRPTQDLYGMIDPKESNLDTIQEQLRIYQSAVNQRVRLARNEVANLGNKVNHLQVAVMNQARLITLLYEHLGLDLPSVNNDVPEFHQEYEDSPMLDEAVNTQGASE